jgi:hypothetical protein
MALWLDTAVKLTTRLLPDETRDVVTQRYFRWVGFTAHLRVKTGQVGD